MHTLLPHLGLVDLLHRIWLNGNGNLWCIQTVTLFMKSLLLLRFHCVMDWWCKHNILAPQRNQMVNKNSQQLVALET